MIRVPKEVLDGIKAVRADGRTNMFDVNAVMTIAQELREYALVAYLVDKANQRTYAKGIFTGFEEE